MTIKSTIEGILRAYPVIMMYSTLLLYIMTSDFDYLYLFFALWIGEGINYNLKYNFFRPIFGDNIPFLGRGARPYAAKDCGLFLSKKQKKINFLWNAIRHSQNSALFATFLILKLLSSGVTNIQSYIKIAIIAGWSLSVG